MKKRIIKMLCASCIILNTDAASAQEKSNLSKTLVLWDGMAVAGYVNHGAFVNFGGPTVRFVQKPVSIGFGILPTMRIKKDAVPKESPKNSPVTPTAGFGFTFVYKHVVLQVPFYYNGKTSTSDGKWNAGIGLGYKF